VAGQSGHNLSIAKSRLGAPRFPFERSDVGDGYAGAGPVTVRQMTPDERAKYGPPEIPKDRILTRGEVVFAVEQASSLQHAARMARVSVTRMKNEMARHCVAVPGKWKEDKPMEENTQLIIEKPEYKNLGVDGNPNTTESVGQAEPETQPKTRREIIHERITKEQYLELKAQGMSDKKIIEIQGIPTNWLDAFGLVKRGEWGITTPKVVKNPDNPGQQEPQVSETKASEEPTQETTGRLTIAQVVQLREELIEDLDDITRIIENIDYASPRVEKLLEYYRNIFQCSLDRINKVFSTTEVAL